MSKQESEIVVTLNRDEILVTKNGEVFGSHPNCDPHELWLVIDILKNRYNITEFTVKNYTRSKEDDEPRWSDPDR
jgi:hypothetical protein